MPAPRSTAPAAALDPLAAIDPPPAPGREKPRRLGPEPPAPRPRPGIAPACAGEALAQGRAERLAAGHTGPPLLIAGPPGSGRAACLAARVGALRASGATPDEVLVLAAQPRLASALADRIARTRAPGLGRGALADQEVLTPPELALALLRAHGERAGVDPFFVVATRAERLALMLRRLQAAGGAPPSGRPERRALNRVVDAIERIDRAKAAGGPGHDHGLMERREAVGSTALDPGAPGLETLSFEALRAEHDRLLAAHGALDRGDLVLRACALLELDGDVRRRLGARYRHLLVDGIELASGACMRLVELLAGTIDEVALSGDRRAVAAWDARDPGARVVVLASSVRRPRALVRAVDAASAVESPEGPRAGAARAGRATPDARAALALWRCPDDRAQAECVADDIARALAAAPSLRVGVLAHALEREGPALVCALKERGIRSRVPAATAFMARAEVRDLLAWLRLVASPQDASAVSRLLLRPPVSLRPAELAHVTQLARRGRLDMRAAVAAAVDSPQSAPEARARMSAFVALHAEIAEAAALLPPDELVHRIVERAGLRRMRLLEPDAETVESIACLTRIERAARHFVRLLPDASASDVAALLMAAAEAGVALGDEPLAAPVAATAAARQPGTAPGARGDEVAPVEVMGISAAPGIELDHVYLTGLAARHGLAEGNRGKEGDWGTEGDRGTRGDWATGGEAGGRVLAAAIACARERAVLVYADRDGEGATQRPMAAVEAVRLATAGEWERREPARAPAAGNLDAGIRKLGREVLADAASIGRRLGELRLDTDYDIARGVVRYLELMKLCALGDGDGASAGGAERAQALADLNARIHSASTPLQRELLAASELDATLLRAVGRAAAGVPGGGGDEGAATGAGPSGGGHARQVAADENDAQLASLLPRHGAGLALSASDIDTYRTCPLRYKLSRLLKLPAQPTPQQRFGIAVHQVLERYHSAQPRRGEGPPPLPVLLRLLDGAWRRAGLGMGERERPFYERARDALRAYHRQLEAHDGEPVWFERPFAFPVGPHVVRGRVDRVDRLPDGSHELIDYKTGRPRDAAALAGDVQLSLYALAAEDAWRLGPTRQAYYYILDNLKVPLPHGTEAPRQRITDAIMEAGAGILALRFAPRPSYEVCAACDYLAVCPAAEG